MRLGFICSHGDLALLLSPTPRTAPATQHTHTHTGRLKAVRTMCVSSCLETDCQPGKTHLGFIFMCHPRFKNNRAARKASLPHPEPTQRPLILAMNTTQASQSPGCKPRHAAGFVETLQRAAIGLNSRPHPPDFLFPLCGARAAGEVWEGGRRLGLKWALAFRRLGGKGGRAGGGAQRAAGRLLLDLRRCFRITPAGGPERWWKLSARLPRGSLVPCRPGRALGDNWVPWRVSVGHLLMPALYLRGPSKTQSPKSVPAPTAGK